MISTGKKQIKTKMKYQDLLALNKPLPLLHCIAQGGLALLRAWIIGMYHTATNLKSILVSNRMYKTKVNNTKNYREYKTTETSQWQKACEMVWKIFQQPL